ncbi:MAG: hypothetical protein ACI9KE_005752 [Polyangiales bacterium]|jgi:hypothetical protein
MTGALPLIGCGLWLMVAALTGAVMSMSVAGWSKFLLALGLFVGVFRLYSLLARRRLTAGADGIRITRWLRRPRFYSWDKVVGFVRKKHKLILQTMEGDQHVGTHVSTAPDPSVDARPTWAPGLGENATYNDLVSAATTHFEQSGRLRCAEVIEGLPPTEWRAALVKCLESGDYRGRGLSREDLVFDLENPAAPIELRATIASLIRPRVDDAKRFRSAFEAAAAPRVRVAMEEAMERVEAFEASADQEREH